MIHTYAYLMGTVVFLVALFLSKRVMLRIGMTAGLGVNFAALLYALAAVFGMLQMFALKYPNEFWPNFGLFGFLMFIIVLHIVVLGTRSGPLISK